MLPQQTARGPLLSYTWRHTSTTFQVCFRRQASRHALHIQFIGLTDAREVFPPFHPFTRPDSSVTTVVSVCTAFHFVHTMYLCVPYRYSVDNHCFLKPNGFKRNPIMFSVRNELNFYVGIRQIIFIIQLLYTQRLLPLSHT